MAGEKEGGSAQKGSGSGALSPESRASRVASSEFVGRKASDMEGVYSMVLGHVKSAERVAFAAGRMAERAGCVSVLRSYLARAPQISERVPGPIADGVVLAIRKTIQALIESLEAGDRPAAGPHGPSGAVEAPK